MSLDANQALICDHYEQLVNRKNYAAVADAQHRRTPRSPNADRRGRRRR